MTLRLLRATLVGALALGLLTVAAPAATAAPAPSSIVARSAVPAAVPLVYGERNRHVTRVQRILSVQQTGFFGPLTRKAVKRFQAGSGLRVTGAVNAATWKALLRLEARQRAARDAAPAPSTSSVDPTMTTAARGSRSARELVSFAAWQASPHGKMIVKRESGGSCTITSPSGAYRGKWQMSSLFWKTYGGLAYASSADRATCLEQDKVAYKGWLASWWHPWGG
jgi:peptidoglycan hydrolase-like protein with peptidoglycan-binding domain